ncbi:MAG: hypothetical protein R3324_12550, partial [Halobacteriales archaeon]|nr:hypothetical protein [Halobacteriales archaeon]
PPTDWAGTQSAWRAVFSLASRIRSGDLTADQIRVNVEHTIGYRSSSEASLATRYADRHLPDDVPEDSRATIQSAIDALVEGDRAAASTALQDDFASPCQTDVPELIHRECGNEVACHLYEPTARAEDRR